MSIVLKGFSLQKGVEFRIDKDGIIWIGNYNTGKKAKEIPPHGRLVDLDKWLEENNFQRYQSEHYEGMMFGIELLRDLPIVLEAEG